MVGARAVSTERATTTPIVESVLRDLPHGDGDLVRTWRFGTGAGQTLRENVVVRIGPRGRDRRRGLVLCGHMDVVAVEEPGAWRSDPFDLTVRADRVFGRGTTDMLGAVAVFAEEAKRLDPSKLAAPLFLLLTRDEEIGTLGAQALAEERRLDEQLPEATVIGEPTGNRMLVGHKGHLRLLMEVTGKAAHSAAPKEGVNAIRVANEVSRQFDVVQQGWQERGASAAIRQLFTEYPYRTVEPVPFVDPGGAANVIPDSARRRFSVRLLPDDDPREVIEELATAVAPLLRTLGGQIALSAEGASAPYMLQQNTRIEGHLCSALGLGKRLRLAAPYTTDAGALQRLGLQSVIVGPGEPKVMHQVDEFVEATALEAFGELVRGAIGRFCLANR